MKKKKNGCKKKPLPYSGTYRFIFDQVRLYNWSSHKNNKDIFLPCQTLYQCQSHDQIYKLSILLSEHLPFDIIDSIILKDFKYCPRCKKCDTFECFKCEKVLHINNKRTLMYGEDVSTQICLPEEMRVKVKNENSICFKNGGFFNFMIDHAQFLAYQVNKDTLNLNAQKRNVFLDLNLDKENKYYDLLINDLLDKEYNPVLESGKFRLTYIEKENTLNIQIEEMRVVYEDDTHEYLNGFDLITDHKNQPCVNMLVKE